MKLFGIFRDSTLNNTPTGFAWDIKNFLNFRKLGVLINEFGCIIFQKPVSNQDNKYNLSPNYLPVTSRRHDIGTIPLDSDKVLKFSIGYPKDIADGTAPIYSEIGILHKTGYYQAVLNDYDNAIYTSGNKLNFSADYPISGEYTYNYKGDLIVAFTDTNTKPKLLNLTHYIDNPPSLSDLFDINDILMFPDKINPKVDNLTINDNGGVLKSGVYYLTYYYRNNTGIQTDYTPIDNPISIYSHVTTGNTLKILGDIANTPTNKSISVNLSNVDTRFNTLVVSVIKKIDGVITAQEVKELPISASTLTYTYTGGEKAIDIDINEILIAKAYFEKIDGFTQVSKRLYSYGLTEQQRVNFQLSALDIELSVVSQLIDPIVSAQTSKLKEYFYDNKGFQHREVYAAYIHLVYANGKLSEGFHIPCPDKSTYASNPLAASSVVRLSSYKKFQVEDTTEVISIGSESEIKMGYWENSTEVYPDLPEFGALAGTPVRHHRMPSLAWIKQHIASATANYGITKMDILGIKASNVVIPVDILYNNGVDATDGYRVVGWTLSYAKRDYNNCTVIGQSHVVFEQAQVLPTPVATYTGSGLNTNMQYFDGSTLFSMFMIGNKQRIFDFSLIRNTPSISPVFITHELKYATTPAVDTATVSGRASYAIDFTQPSINICLSSNDDGSGLVNPLNKYQTIETYNYIPAQGIIGSFNHLRNEDSLVLTTNELFTTGDMTAGFKNFSLANVSFGAYTLLSTLASVCAIPDNIYETFYNQELIQTGKFFNYSNTEGTFYKGDIFINYYGYHSTTWGTNPADIYVYQGDKGIVLECVYMCEQRDNVGLRYIDDDNLNTFHYPESNPLYIAGLNRDTIELSKTYNNDYSSQNDLNIALPYNPFLETVVKHNYRINRTTSQQEEAKRLSWSIWLINDYYESVKNKGVIKNIQGADRDLYINHEQALYITVGNEQFDSNGTTAFIGAGNIFERPAQEILPSKEGIIGTTNKFSCLLTKYGYIVVDRVQGKVWLINNRQASELSAQGLTEFFFNNLDYTFVNPVNNTDLPEDNPYFFFGITTAFDLENERIIICKKAYEPTEQLLQDIANSYVTLQDGRFIYDNVAKFVISYRDTTYWTDKSVTISYSFDNVIEKSSWCSFHDYIPDFMFNTRNLLLGSVSRSISGEYGSFIYKHNYKDNKAIFYNSTIYNIDTDTEAATPYSSYIVPVFNTQDTNDKLFFNVYWIIQMLNSNKAYLNETQGFTKLLAWNSYQSTKDTPLVPYTFGNFDTNCRKIKHTWNYNSLRDWLRTDILTNPNPPEPFIVGSDLNPDLSPAPIDTNKPFELRQPLIDKFLLVKLLYSNEFINNLQNEIQVVEVGTEYQIVPR